MGKQILRRLVRNSVEGFCRMECCLNTVQREKKRVGRDFRGNSLKNMRLWDREDREEEGGILMGLLRDTGDA